MQPLGLNLSFGEPWIPAITATQSTELEGLAQAEHAKRVRSSNSARADIQETAQGVKQLRAGAERIAEFCECTDLTVVKQSVAPCTKAAVMLPRGTCKRDMRDRRAYALPTITGPDETSRDIALTTTYVDWQTEITPALRQKLTQLVCNAVSTNP